MTAGSRAYSDFRDACKKCVECVSSFKIERAGLSLAEDLTEFLRIFNPVIVEKAYTALDKGKTYRSAEDCDAYLIKDSIRDGFDAMQKYILSAEVSKGGVAEFAIRSEGGDYAFRLTFNGSGIFAAIDRSHLWAGAIPKIIIGFCTAKGILDRLEAE